MLHQVSTGDAGHGRLARIDSSRGTASRERHRQTLPSASHAAACRYSLSLAAALSQPDQGHKRDVALCISAGVAENDLQDPELRSFTTATFEQSGVLV